MSNETNMNNEKISISYGAKLKTARESLGLEVKDIAAQLRLGERIIEMLESGHYSPDVPNTFLRGYIRSYSKLLQMPELEITSALEGAKPAPTTQEPIICKQQANEVTSSNYFMQFSTYAIVATLTGMLGLWWFNHTASQSTVLAQNEVIALPDVQKPIEPRQVPSTTQTASLAPTSNTAAVTPSTQAPTTKLASSEQIAPKATEAATSTKPSTAVSSQDDDDDDDEEDNNRD